VGPLTRLSQAHLTEGCRLTGRVLTVGLTGGLGAGKSAVAARLRELGAIVIDSDVLAREVVAKGTPGLAAVVAAFGDAMLRPDGELDRAALAARVFGDETARKRLEGIIHPLVRARTAELTREAPPGSVVVNDVPLLVEAGLSRAYDLVIVVLAAESTRVQRLIRDRGMSPEQIRERMAAQASDDQRRAVADIVLANDDGLDELRARVDAVWRDQLVPRAAAGS
jgi:dephospho-CoA kinase